MAGQLDPEKILEQMEGLPSSARYGVLFAVLLLVLGVYYFAFFGGERTRLQSFERTLAKLEAEIAEARTVAANLETFRKRGEELRKELDQALSRLPNQKELPMLLTDISSLGKKAGLEFRAFKPRTEVDRGFYAEVPIDIEFFGSYHEVAIFFDRMAQLSRIVNMAELDMKLDSEQGDRPQLRVKGVATTFRFVDSSRSAANSGT